MRVWRRFVSQNAVELLCTVGAALSHEMGDPTPNSTSVGLKLHEGILDVSAHPMLRGTAVLVNYTRIYRVFPLFVEFASRSNFLIFFSWVQKKRCPDDDKNVESIF